MNYPVVEWVRQNSVLNTIGYESYPVITVDLSGNIYGAYTTDGTVSGQTLTGTTNIVVFKMNTDGSVEWVRQNSTINASTISYDPKIVTDSSGYIYVSYDSPGISSGQSNVGGWDIVVLKMTPVGDVLWVKQNKRIDTTSNDFNYSIISDNYGNVYIAYNTYGGTASGEKRTTTPDIVIVKMDLSGEVVWVRQNSTINASGSNYYPSICIDISGNIYLSYTTYGTASGNTRIGGSDIVVLKMNPDGYVEWIHQSSIINTTANENFPSIFVDKDTNIYIAYTTYGTTSGQTNIGSNDIVVVKLNSSGSVVWIRQNNIFNTLSDENYPNITTDLQGNIYATYVTDGTVSGQSNTGAQDIVILKMNSSGDVEWIQQNNMINTPALDEYPQIAVDSSRNIYVIYTTEGTASGQTNSGVTDIVIVKLRQAPFITNSFPVTTASSYLSLGPILLFTQAVVDALQANSDLPADPLVSWLPESGLSAGSLLRDLKKTVVVMRNKLQTHKFRLVQLIDGAATEGVGGTVSDVEPFRCGYICTWAASGSPFMQTM